MIERPMTAPEAAGELGYHPDHVRRLLRSGKIRGELVGGRWWIAPAEVARIRELQGPDGRLPYGFKAEA